MTRVTLLLAGVIAVFASTLGAGAEKRAIAPPGIKPIGPYSPGVLAGDFLYVSGQGGRDADGKLPDTVEGQVRQTLQNVQLLILHWQVAGFAPHAQLTLATATSPRLAYAVPVLIGTVVAAWLR